MAKIGKKLLVLKFEDPDFEGVEVQAYSTSLGLALGLSGQAEFARQETDSDQFSGLLDAFLERLHSWNIEDEQDRPVPATREGLYSLDLSDARYILVSWFDAMMSVHKSLGKDSTDGEPSPELSLPMEPRSSNPPNWPMPNSSSDSVNASTASPAS